MPLPHMCYLPKLVVLGQTVRALLRKSAGKKLTHHVPPFEDAQGHRNRHGSIGYLWLPINAPQQPWAYVVLFPR